MASEALPAHQVALAGGHGPAWEEDLLALKRKIYSGYLAVSSIAVALILVGPVAGLEPGAQRIAYAVLPLWFVVAVPAIVAMQRWARAVVFVERLLYFVAYPLYVGTGAMLMFTADDPLRQVEYFHVTALWMPVAYVWAFIAFGTRRGLFAAGALLAAFVVAVNVGAAYGPNGGASAASQPAGALFLTSSVVLILALFVMWTFIELQTRGRAAAETLARFATVDALTGLPNRRALETRLEHDFAVAQRNRGVIAAYFVDLDDLKGVNDTYGHQGGDELIKRFAERLRSIVRATDIVARISGDEFVVAGFVGAKADAEALANKLLRATAKPFVIAGDHVVDVGASIGVSLYPDHAEDVAGLLRKADVAMYAAKLSGKNRWRSAADIGAERPGTLLNDVGSGGAHADEALRS